MLQLDEQRKQLLVMINQKNQNFLHINEGSEDEDFIIKMNQEHHDL